MRIHRHNLLLAEGRSLFWWALVNGFDYSETGRLHWWVIPVSLVGGLIAGAYTQAHDGPLIG